MNLRHWKPLFAGLVAWIGLGSAASCSSDDQVPGGGRIEHPLEPSAMKTPPPPTSPAPPPASTAETSAPSAPSVDRPRTLSEIFEGRTGLKLSPLDKAIMDDCPARAWSKTVPKRRCAKDDECGDGFCDRGQCTAIWSCGGERYGQRCNKQHHCGIHLCIDGRCRSCVSDMECEQVRIVEDGKCTPDLVIPGARECNGVVPSIPGDAAPGPLPQKPGQ